MLAPRTRGKKLGHKVFSRPRLVPEGNEGKKICDTVTFSFIYGNYCPTID